ncbi:hypothetical protein [Caulobacter segnis]
MVNSAAFQKWYPQAKNLIATLRYMNLHYGQDSSTVNAEIIDVPNSVNDMTPLDLGYAGDRLLVQFTTQQVAGAGAETIFPTSGPDIGKYVIRINPTQLEAAGSRFGMGAPTQLDIVYTIFHEIAHATKESLDLRNAYWNGQGYAAGAAATLEQFANKLGSNLAQFAGYTYPNELQLLAGSRYGFPPATWDYDADVPAGSHNLVIGDGELSASGLLASQASSDHLSAGTLGDDILIGTASADTLRGGKGFDALLGGAGADTFVLEMGGDVDRVYDFSAEDGDRVHVYSDSYSVDQVGADTVVKLSDGSKMILMGVNLGGLADGWIYST